MIIVGIGEQFETIQAALDSIKDENQTIFIKNGVYYEKLVINKRVKLVGENKELTVITYDDYAKKLDDSGNTLETFRTATLLVLSDGVEFSNLTIQNSSGRGNIKGQAVALFLNADHIKVINCQIIGYQDTLLTGPIPKDAKNQENLNFSIEHNAVYHHYFESCFIQGDVDFIFGSANALFVKCIIYSNNLDKDINGYISAPSTEENQMGHIFYECQLLSDAKPNSVYLGRSWREHAHSVYINCFMGPHIHREGFAKWDQKYLKSRFFEYGSYGPGAYRENGLSKVLDETELAKYLQIISDWIDN